MSRQKPSWKSDQSWRDRPSPIHEERMDREMKRGVANDKRREITSFPFEDVVAVAEFIANLHAAASRGIAQCQQLAADADDPVDAGHHVAEELFWRGVKAGMEAIEKGSTVAL